MIFHALLQTVQNSGCVLIYVIFQERYTFLVLGKVDCLIIGITICIVTILELTIFTVGRSSKDVETSFSIALLVFRIASMVSTTHTSSWRTLLRMAAGFNKSWKKAQP